MPNKARHKPLKDRFAAAMAGHTEAEIELYTGLSRDKIKRILSGITKSIEVGQALRIAAYLKIDPWDIAAEPMPSGLTQPAGAAVDVALSEGRPPTLRELREMLETIKSEIHAEVDTIHAEIADVRARIDQAEAHADAGDAMLQKSIAGLLTQYADLATPASPPHAEKGGQTHSMQRSRAR